MKKNSQSVYTMGHHEGTLNNEYDDISLKTKLVLTPFGGTFGMLKFNEKSFFKSLLGFTPYQEDYKITNAIYAESQSYILVIKTLILVQQLTST